MFLRLKKDTINNCQFGLPWTHSVYSHDTQDLLAVTSAGLISSRPSCKTLILLAANSYVQLNPPLESV